MGKIETCCRISLISWLAQSLHSIVACWSPFLVVFYFRFYGENCRVLYVDVVVVVSCASLLLDSAASSRIGLCLPSGLLSVRTSVAHRGRVAGGIPSSSLDDASGAEGVYLVFRIFPDGVLARLRTVNCRWPRLCVFNASSSCVFEENPSLPWSDISDPEPTDGLRRGTSPCCLFSSSAIMLSTRRGW